MEKTNSIPQSGSKNTEVAPVTTHHTMELRGSKSTISIGDKKDNHPADEFLLDDTSNQVSNAPSAAKSSNLVRNILIPLVLVLIILNVVIWRS